MAGLSQDDMVKEIERLRERLALLESQGDADKDGASGKKRTENARMTKSKGKEIGGNEGHLGGEFEYKENPEFIAKRLAVYERFKAKKDEELQAMPKEEIQVTLPDGKVVKGIAWETSPMKIAADISAGLANSVVVAKVFYTRRVGKVIKLADSSGFEEDEDNAINTGELWDLIRPLEGDCKLELLKFDDKEAKMVFWHSSAHILGECIECKFGSHLTVGPPINPGFYYDTYVGSSGEGIKEENKKKLEEKAKQVIKEKQPFERIVLTKDEALELFQDNPFKLSIIRNKVQDGTLTSAYRCGPLIDLCMGPHIPHTGKVKAFEITQATSAFWLGDVSNDPLQRVYGISFPDKKLLKAHKEHMKRAAENDHRKKGEQQKLFFFHDYSPGSAFFLPHGARIFNALLTYMREEYHNRGYTEVVSPNMYNVKLWQQSGHWEHYRDDMFSFSADNDKDVFGLKPMNCPGHCLMYNHSRKSYRELPVRMADFGVLHRNEASGALSGLTRVRRFQQDDGHIFCSQEDLETELLGCLNFMKSVYETFGMTYKLHRSTRPAKACGLVDDEGNPDPEGIALWDNAEAVLATVLDKFAGPGNWRDNPGDGAFYGPKIDIKVYDCMGREFQCATVQCDFQNPIRFDLSFEGKNGPERPVMIHRAMLGSLERMIAILTEHFAGKWPFWLSPRQAIVIPVHQDYNEFAEGIGRRMHNAGIYCDVDASSGKTLNKKILLAQKEQYNFMLIVGKKELEEDCVNIRTRLDRRLGFKKVDETIEMFVKWKETRQMDTEPEPKEFVKDGKDGK
uniref:Probable threonine--tRNA ligase, cytoplasmic n=1 Tax=Mucochytrium quahogii TaxID=96639 RepID=A0A7S2RNE7_9STRA|mmetsp:Transcript_21224/g.34525  ORF Transcript_21224/g.34525 Transcript_21224/m.34525 type:complete len:794 (-) Transcript_21224:614-2995(-)|eukprot:CAMPEP_0203747136 /NCGR_PEP_ID=MMETSP0098-20131031/2370_1 /ASSEMBLY_ACC=CAM_ASM_000208 /TAXON_ID=96639 /ORGANISM=" , Strain NY0313808BC1" /LENGTH=793 /DNA_ID=CAMNT_0050635473 /DNA_START=3358 /DNA_END=5739 /DNA_ORIENTATION=-